MWYLTIVIKLISLFILSMNMGIMPLARTNSSTFIMVPIISYPISRPECISLLRETDGFFRTISPTAALIVTVTSIIAPSPVSIISAQNISAELPVLPRYSRLE